MEDNQNLQQSPDFSDIPSLGDISGLEAYLNNEALKAQGLPVEQQTQPQQQVQPTVQPTVQSNQQQTQTQVAPTQTQGQPSDGNVVLTKEQFQQIQQLLAGRGVQQAQTQPQQQVQQKQVQTGYTPQEQQFIIKALSQGYALDQINRVIMQNRGGQGVNPAINQRIAQIEEYLKTQEYKAAETAFITKLSNFGEKFGLSEQDLVTFGNEALKHGINIAMGDVNLETVFRAVYPEQYAIRSRRMIPTNSSQIYGGTSIPEAPRTAVSKMEDAYVEAFLKGAMPAQYDLLNKK